MYHSPYTDKESEVVEHYSSVTEMLDACKQAWNEGRRADTIRYKGAFCTMRPNRNWVQDSWVGRQFDDLDHVISSYYQPWMEGLDIVQEMIYEIEREGYELPVPKVRKRRPVFHPDDGDELDRDRLYSGQDCWRKCIRQNVSGPQFITLLSATSTRSTERPENILWRGAVSIVLADAFEKQGYRVKFVVTDYTCNAYPEGPLSGKQEFVSAVVKEEQDTLDISSITNTVSGWFFRTIMGFQTKHVTKQGTPSSGYGRPKTMMENSPDVLKLAGPGSIPIVIDAVWSRQQALAKVRQVINQINGVEDE